MNSKLTLILTPGSQRWAKRCRKSSRSNVFKKRSNRNMLKKRSVFNRILIPLIIVQIFQISLFGMLVFSGGVITKLDRNAEEILNERVINRKNYLENEMIVEYDSNLYLKYKLQIIERVILIKFLRYIFVWDNLLFL